MFAEIDQTLTVSSSPSKLGRNHLSNGYWFSAELTAEIQSRKQFKPWCEVMLVTIMFSWHNWTMQGRKHWPVVLLPVSSCSCQLSGLTRLHHILPSSSKIWASLISGTSTHMRAQMLRWIPASNVQLVWSLPSFLFSFDRSSCLSSWCLAMLSYACLAQFSQIIYCQWNDKAKRGRKPG